MRVVASGPAALDLKAFLASTSDRSANCGKIDVAGTAQGPFVKAFVIKTIPQCMGSLRLELLTSFADGGFEIDTAFVTVTAKRPALSIRSERGPGDHGVLAMDLSLSHRLKGLRIQAVFPGVTKPISVPANALRFTVLQDQAEPAIAFAPDTERVDAIRVGTALIITSYGELTDRTCVVVAESEARFHDSSACDGLEQGQGSSQTKQVDRTLSRSGSSLPYTATDSRTGRFLADERVELPAPDHPLRLAEDNLLELRVRQGTIARIECSSGNEACQPWRGAPSRESLPVSTDAEGRRFMHVFAPEPGRVKLRFTILFTDGGLATRVLDANVENSPTALRSVGDACSQAGNWSLAMPTRLTIGGPDGFGYMSTQALRIFGCYDGERRPLLLQGSPVTYEVLSEGRTPVVQVDSLSGNATSLRVGQALVLEHLYGKTTAQCVIVDPWERRETPDLSNCRDLRRKYGHPLVPIDVSISTPAVIRDAPAASSSPAVKGLGLAGAALPGPPVMNAISAGTLSPLARDRFLANARLQVQLTGVVAVLGRASRIPIRLNGPDVLSMRLYQEHLRVVPDKESKLFTEHDEEVEETSTIYRAGDGTLFLDVHAVKAVTAMFRISVLFADGGVAEQQFVVPVRPPDEKPVEFLLYPEGLDYAPKGPLSIRMSLDQPASTRTLFPYISYEEHRVSFPLSFKEVTFSVSNNTGAPVIEIDQKTGSVRALRAGSAVVLARFHDAEAETCVVVSQTGEPEASGSCESVGPQP